MISSVATPGCIGGDAGRWLGSVLVVHFVIVCLIKCQLGLAAEILWMSHMGLLVAGTGLLFRSTLLVTTAYTCLLVLHGLWLVDCLTWVLAGVFPIGATTYLDGADWRVWLATAHHFYLAPLLLVLVNRHGRWPAETLLAAVAFYLPLTVVSRAWFAPADNINYAFGVLTAWDHPLLDWINRQDGSIYLPGLNAFVATVMFAPAARLGQWLCRHRQTDQPRDLPRLQCAS